MITNYTTQALNAETVCIHFQADLLQTDAEFTQQIEQFIQKGILYFIISLEKVRYVNSSGLNLLLTILTKSRNAGGELILINPNQTITNLLMVTKLNQVFVIQPDLPSAISSLEQPTT